MLKSLSLALADPQPHYELELYSRDPKAPTQKFSGPVGLDGLYRKGDPAPIAGVSAVKAHWVNSHTLVVNNASIGGSNPAQRWTLWFDGDALNIRGRADGRDVSIDGGLGG